MKHSIIIILFLILSFNGVAQCDPDTLLYRKGKWKKEADANVYPDKTFPKSQFSLVNTRIDNIYSLLKGTILNLSGSEATWYRAISGESYLPNGPLPYDLGTLYFHFYCNTNLNKIIVGDETNTGIRIFVNKLSWFLYQADTLDINGDGKIRTVYQLPPKERQINGMTVYKLKSHSVYANSNAIILGRNGKVPWRSITQKQYLTGLKRQYEKKLITVRKNTSSEADYKNKLKNIDDYLSSTDDETLQKTAIIDPKSGIWGFKGKFGEEDEGGFRLVLFAGSESFFDKSLSRYVPQLIQIYWSYDKSAASQNVRNQFEKDFPFDKLKEMIQ